ncbi:MAG: hypothetical protein ABI233_00720 [Chthoniobacterales bacterium]
MTTPFLRGPVFLLAALVISSQYPVAAQEAGAGVGIDLLYPEFAHPREDVAASIKRDDLRFIATDRARRIVPGMEHSRNLLRQYRVKHIRQRFRLFPSRSQNFSYNLRAEAYAREYNLTLKQYLLSHPKKK